MRAMRVIIPDWGLDRAKVLQTHPGIGTGTHSANGA
jgi:hypothetical protein